MLATVVAFAILILLFATWLITYAERLEVWRLIVLLLAVVGACAAVSVVGGFFFALEWGDPATAPESGASTAGDDGMVLLVMRLWPFVLIAVGIWVLWRVMIRLWTLGATVQGEEP